MAAARLSQTESRSNCGAGNLLIARRSPCRRSTNCICVVSATPPCGAEHSGHGAGLGRTVLTSDGWPGFPGSSFPFQDCGCPVLAFLARARTMLLVPWICYAQRPASELRRPSPALYHLLLLPAIAFSRHRAQPRYLPCDSGTDSRALSVRSRRVCRDAGTHSPAFDGTRSRVSLDRDASGEAAHGPRFVTQTQAEESAPTQPVWRAEAQSVLAGALLRLQRMDDEEARGETPVYASQSGEAGLGRHSGGVAVEQLSLLSSG